ncbi:MAG TPA: alpha/beta hydrolase [Planctomycetaceae bacterium]|nr:alpha/beta hydrolase [Planctomycetaceae bacterium]
MSRVRTVFRAGCLTLLISLIGALPLSAQEKKPPQKPRPDVAEFKYGPHARHVLDLWKAKSDQPTPLVIFIHGGGFHGGQKLHFEPELLTGCLNAGLSMASINYRLSPEVRFPDHYMDCARAIQALRLHAAEFNVDPKRFAAVGNSAGAGTSLWIAFHDDMADPASSDPVLRQSTRLSCVAVIGGQGTYDPRAIKQLVGGRAHEHPALQGFYGLKDDELDSPKAHALYEKAAAVNYLTADDPPVFGWYAEPKGPLPPDAKPGQGIHHPNFGLDLKQRMDKLGIECLIRHQDEGGNQSQEIVAFLKKHLE